MLWRLLAALLAGLWVGACRSAAARRRCAFQVTPETARYGAAGSVSGSEQLCDNTRCCVGYFWMVDGRPKVDVLACDIFEKSCPDTTCRAQPRFTNFTKCVCSTDFCNSNISWSATSQPPHRTSSSSADGIARTAVKLSVVILLVLLAFFASKWKNSFKEKSRVIRSSGPDYSLLPLCSCHPSSSAEIHMANLQLQQIVGQGHFAAVFQGRYKGSMVAVKVFPPGWKYRFAAEKEVYELPLMKHAGIVHFLGTGRKPDDSSRFIVMQFAEYGSLHSFLCKYTTSWMLSLKLCQSLSQGLSYLHSDLLCHDLHKPPVAHRDLSSFNVLVRADISCVLSDFGSSTILWSCSRRSLCSSMQAPAAQATLRYMSPELLEGSVNLSSSDFLLQGDIYALGLLLWEIWTRCSDLYQGSAVPQCLLPYELELGVSATLESLILHVSTLNKRPSIPAHWELLPQGSGLASVLTDCWDSDPGARLSAQCVVDRLVSLQDSDSP